MRLATRRAAFLSALALATTCGGAFAQPGPPKPVAVLTDAKLVQAVMKAAKEKVAAQLVETRVGQRAIVNTTRPGDRDVRTAADLAFDPTRSSQAKSLKGAEIAYWRRPIKSATPQVVGIVWPTSGAPQYFFGIVLPR